MTASLAGISLSAIARRLRDDRPFWFLFVGMLATLGVSLIGLVAVPGSLPARPPG